MKPKAVPDSEEKRTVALIMPPVPSYSRALMEGVIRAHASSRQWHLIDLPHSKVGRSPLPLRHGRMDAAIIWADRQDTWVARLAAEGVKIVNCESDWVGVPGIASVYVNRKIICEALVEHIHSIGLRQLVIVGHLISRRPGMSRLLEAVAEHARASGIEVALWELEGRNNPGDAPRRLLEAEKEHKLGEMLRRIPKPAAVFCENDHIAVMVCRMARLAEFRIPECLAVVGYGNNLISQFSDPPLTTISVPGQMVGSAAADLLAKWFREESVQPADVILHQADLEVRESTLGLSGDASMERVRRFIRRNDDQGTSLATLANVAGVSSKTLIRKYTEAFGVDPLEDLRARRLEKAKALLNEKKIPISDVAAKCGFSSQANFYNYFLRHTGMSPTIYRTGSEIER